MCLCSEHRSRHNYTLWAEDRNVTVKAGGIDSCHLILACRWDNDMPFPILCESTAGRIDWTLLKVDLLSIFNHSTIQPTNALYILVMFIRFFSLVTSCRSLRSIWPPFRGFLVWKCAFCSEWPAHWLHNFYSSWYDCQSHLAVNQETWVRNDRWIWLTQHFYSCP
jgi:hypothetical protein